MIMKLTTFNYPQSQLVARRLKVPPATSHTFRLFSLNNIHLYGGQMEEYKKSTTYVRLYGAHNAAALSDRAS